MQTFQLITGPTGEISVVVTNVYDAPHKNKGTPPRGHYKRTKSRMLSLLLKGVRR